MSTSGTVLAYCLPIHDMIQVLSAGLLLHKWTRDRLVYVLSCNKGWAKWAQSIGLALCTLMVNRLCTDFCQAEEMWCVQYCCSKRCIVSCGCREYCHTVILSTYIYIAQCMWHHSVCFDGCRFIVSILLVLFFELLLWFSLFFIFPCHCGDNASFEFLKLSRCSLFSF
jgi:hypothetical protein